MINLSGIAHNLSGIISSPQTIGILLAIFLIWSLLLTFLLIKNLFWLKKIFGKTSQNDLKSILQEHIERVGIVQIKLNDLEQEIHKIKKENLRNIQKIGIVRYNPFEDTGGNQSFALSFLDKQNNGFVLTSMHGREKTRMYIKPVIKGQPGPHPFSKEEIEAIEKAQKNED